MSRTRKQLSIEELRTKQAEITRQLEQAEQAEQVVIGQKVQRITGMASWNDINTKWQLIPRDKPQEMVPDDDEPFPIKDPFHLEATAR